MFTDFNTTRAVFNQHVPSRLLAVVALQLTGMEFFHVEHAMEDFLSMNYFIVLDVKNGYGQSL